MRRLIPSPVELAIFAALAVICTGVVAGFQQNAHDLGMAALVGPVFLVAACMGLRRSPIWMQVTADETDENHPDLV